MNENYTPPTMVQTDAPDPDWKLTFTREGIGNDNAWITVDDLFAVNIIRTDEGLVVDIYPAQDTEANEPLGSTYVFEHEVACDPSTPPPKCDDCGGRHLSYEPCSEVER